MKKIIFILNIVLFIAIFQLNTGTVLASSNNGEDINVKIGKTVEGYLQGGKSNTFILKPTESGKLKITIDCNVNDMISASLSSDDNADNPIVISGSYDEAKGAVTMSYEVLVSPKTYYLKLTSPIIINNGEIHVATKFDKIESFDSGYVNSSTSGAVVIKNDNYYKGVLAFDEKDDFYTITLKKKQNLKLAVTAKGDEAALVVLENAKGKELAREFIFEGKSVFNFDEKLAAGKYYLIINKGSQVLHTGRIYAISTGKYQLITKVSIPKSKTIYVNNTYDIKPQITPKDANENYTFSSSNSKIVKVSVNGKVTALKKGTATITLTTDEGKIKKTCKITVKEVAVKSIRLNKTNAELKDGGSIVLSASILPDNASIKKVTWVSSNKYVASVSSNGKVTAQSAGTCKITAKIGGISTACSVKVVAKQVVVTTPKPNPTESPKEVTIEVERISILSSLNIYMGKTKSIKDLLAIVTPDNASDKSLTWSSTDSSIVAIEGGTITPKKVGTTRIVVSSRNGKKAYCTVVVKESE